MKPSLVVMEVWAKITEKAYRKGYGLYDPGANASGITLQATKKFGLRFVPYKSSYKTTSGEGSIVGKIILEVRIENISHRPIFYVIDSNDFPYDFIIGLDLIEPYKLDFDKNLTLKQDKVILHKQNNNNVKTSINNTNVNWNDYITKADFDAKTEHLDAQKKNKIFEILCKNRKAFGNHRFDVGNVKKYECKINLTKDTYIAKKPYRCTYEDSEEIERQVNELLSHKMIRPSCSPFASPVTLQYKKDGLSSKKVKSRMCGDYRELNKILVPESQPFPLIDDLLTKTRNCSWFSALDINAAFHSIPIRDSDRHKTAFVTQQGHYEWCSMPFGLKISPAVFQRIISRILQQNEFPSFSTSYIDDILIFSRTFEEHLLHVQRVITVIANEGFLFNFKKCNFARSTIQYLGHILSPNQVRPLNDNLKAISAFPILKTRRHVRQFLGKINFYRKFIPNAVFLLEPLHNLLRKSSPFRWTRDCQESFDKIKALLVSSPILAVFDRTLPIHIYTDASGVGVGAVLKQIQDDGLEKPVAYFSRRLTNAQMKKKAIYIESLAVKEAIRFWRYWLVGRHFTVFTDHKPLENLNLKSRTDEELGDLANELLQFDFQILYRPGKINWEADSLSRNPVLDPLSPEESAVPLLPSFNFLSTSDIEKLQENVTTLSTDSVDKGITYRIVNGQKKIVLNEESGEELIKLVHRFYKHIGKKPTCLIVTKHFTFPNMYRLINSVCNKCTTCIKNKSRTPKRSARLGILGPPSKPYEVMSLDTIGGFVGNNSPYRYFHLLVDHFSRYAFFSCTKGQSARDMVSLIDSVQRRNPIGTLLTDQYGGLSSGEFSSYCTQNSISHIFTAVDSPASNGLNERLNQTLVNKIRCSLNDPSTPRGKSWATIAAECVKAYNLTPHSSTKFSPEYLLSGSHCEIIPSSLFSPPSLEHDRIKAFENASKVHLYNKRNFDKIHKDIEFVVGQKIFVENGNRLNRSKLDSIRSGPFVIQKKLSNNVFVVSAGRGPLCNKIYHASKFVKCTE